MMWYEVIIGIAIVIIGAYIHGKVIAHSSTFGFFRHINPKQKTKRARFFCQDYK